MSKTDRYPIPSSLLPGLVRAVPEAAAVERLGDILSLEGTPGKFITLADKEGVAGVLYSRLKPLGNGWAPLLDGLKTIHLRQAGRNMLAFREIEPFLEAADAAGIRLQMTKGGRLALTVYDDPGQRPFWDIDLFIHPDDWPAASSLLENNGFRMVSGFAPDAGPAPGRPWAFSPYYKKDRIHLEFHGQPLGLAVDLRDREAFWNGSRTIPVGRTRAGILDDEFELCHLCLHAAQHSYSRLIWLLDISVLLERARPSAERIAEICRREGISSIVYKSLCLARAVAGAEVDGALLDRLRPNGRTRKVLDLLWPEDLIAARKPFEPWPYEITTLFCLWERRDLKQAMRVLPGLLFPQPAWVAYVTGEERPGRLSLKRYGQRLFSPAIRLARRIMRLP